MRISVSKKLAALVSIGEHEFEDYFEPVDLMPDKWNSIGALEVRPVFSPHPIETNVYFFRTMGVDGYKVYAHLADIVDLSVLKGMIVEGSSKPGVTLEM